MKRVRVAYFAVLRERRGQSSEVVDTACATVQELYAELCGRHDLGLPLSLVQFAVNETFRPGGTEICDGDEVVFIPPVAGG